MNKKSLEKFTRKVESDTNDILRDSLADEEYIKPDIEYSDIASNSTRDRIKKLPWLVAIFLVFIISITLVYMFLNNNPQTIFTMAIDKFFNGVSSSISDNAYSISKGKVLVKLDLSNDGKYKDLFNEISKNDYSFDYVFDVSNKLSYVKFFLDYDEFREKGYYYGTNKYSYIYFNDIYDKYVRLDEFKPIRLIKNSDIKIILNGINQAFDKITTSEKIVGNRIGIDLGIKTLKVYEATLVIDEKNYGMVADSLINSFKSNSEFIGTMTRNSNKSSDEINKILDKLSLDIKKFFKENEKIAIKLFIDRKSNRFVKATVDGKFVSFSLKEKDSYYEFEFINSKEDVKFDGSIQYKEIDKKTNNVNLIFKLSKDGENTMGNIDVNFSFGKASSFPKVNVKDYVNESGLSDDEKNSIYESLLSKPNYKWVYFIKPSGE